MHLDVGAPFLFKLHAPQGGWIVGGGYAHFATVPATLAWDAGATTTRSQRNQIGLPAAGNPPPSREYLEWHADTVFRG